MCFYRARNKKRIYIQQTPTINQSQIANKKQAASYIRRCLHPLAMIPPAVYAVCIETQTAMPPLPVHNRRNKQQMLIQKGPVYNLKERTVGQGKTVVEGSILIPAPYKKGSDDKGEPAFLDFQIWDKEAEALVANVKDKDIVQLQGELQSNVYTDKNGNKQQKIKLNATTFNIIQRRTKAGESPARSKSGEDPASEADLAAMLGGTAGGYGLSQEQIDKAAAKFNGKKSKSQSQDLDEIFAEDEIPF